MSDTSIQLLEGLFGAMWLISAMLLLLAPPVIRFVEWDMRRVSARERARVKAAVDEGTRWAEAELERIRKGVEDEYAQRRR